MKKRLENKIALVTGAGSGIGEATMKLFAREGATVIGCGRRLETLEKVLADIRSEGREGLMFQADLANHGDAESLVSKIIDNYGRLDVLVHSAGVGMSWADVSENSMNDIATTPFDKWREVMAINLDAVYSICHAALQPMLEQGSGSIVNVASIGGLGGASIGHTYSAAKAGMINLTRCMAVAYATRGVRSNCICPGLTDTPMVETVTEQMAEVPGFLQSVSPMERLGEASEMADVCLFLASDESSYVNGVVLPIDGGKRAE